MRTFTITTVDRKNVEHEIEIVAHSFNVLQEGATNYTSGFQFLDEDRNVVGYVPAFSVKSITNNLEEGD